MTAYRLIAIDLDGTLLMPDGSVSERNRDAIQSCLAAGLLICFATGRNWTESKAIMAAVNHFAKAVFVSGAMVIDTEREVTLHRTMMAPDLARALCAELEDMGHTVLALQDSGTAGVDYLISTRGEVTEPTKQWMKVCQTRIHPVEDLGQYSHEHTIRVGIVATSGESHRVQTALKNRFGDRILCHSLLVPAYGVDVLEVFDPAVNKWEGILHIARHHKVKPEEIIAIGDDMNDVPMIRNAGLGVAMGNAKPDVLAVAKRVIGRNTEDGLAKFLEELVAARSLDGHPILPA